MADVMVTVKSQQQPLIKLANKLAQSSPGDALVCRDAAAELRVHMAENARLTAEGGRLRTALENVLAKADAVDGNPICPCCFVEQWMRQEHRPDCEIARARSVLSQLQP